MLISLEEAKRREKKRRIKIAVISGVVALFFAVSLVITCIPGAWGNIYSAFGMGDFSRAADNYGFKASFIDVQKADAILLEADGESALIDCGNPQNGRDVLRYLKRRDVSHLKYAIATHPDLDHIGGFDTVLREIRTDCIIEPILSDKLKPDSDRQRLLQTVQTLNTTVAQARSGDVFYLGKAEIRVLSPKEEQKDSNDSSLVLLVTYGSTKMLFTGDCTSRIEAEIIKENISVDLLKVAHHGSKTSTSEAFLNRASPAMAVISVGEDGNNLPSTEVIERLLERDIQIYRTDINGTVIAASDGGSLEIITEKEG